jgi:hypothetical protein
LTKKKNSTVAPCGNGVLTLRQWRIEKKWYLTSKGKQGLLVAIVGNFILNIQIKVRIWCLLPGAKQTRVGLGLLSSKGTLVLCSGLYSYTNKNNRETEEVTGEPLV